MKTVTLWTTVLAALVLGGCMSASQHAADVQQGVSGDKLTVGTVQKEIRNGMSGAEVAAALGSPNIVSRDEQGREVWIYDRIATDTVYSSSEGGVSSLILGGFGGSAILGGLVGGGGQQSTGAKSTSQRTLTIIIKFDETGKVSSFAYHSSRF
jgi:outer membrane protein assembly factor BamE (lipoprotein component of BamABCDE complex)